MRHCKLSSRVLEKIKFQEEWQYCCELSEFDNSVAFWLVFFLMMDAEHIKMNTPAIVMIWYEQWTNKQ
jgi:hypothetical protein